MVNVRVYDAIQLLVNWRNMVKCLCKIAVLCNKFDIYFKLGRSIRNKNCMVFTGTLHQSVPIRTELSVPTAKGDKENHKKLFQNKNLKILQTLNLSYIHTGLDCLSSKILQLGLLHDSTAYMMGSCYVLFLLAIHTSAISVVSVIHKKFLRQPESCGAN